MSKIELTDKTWNPIIGYSKISDGCKNCYAEKMACRQRHMNYYDFINAIDENTSCFTDSQYYGPYARVIGLSKDSKKWEWNNKTAFIKSALKKPLKWKKSRKVFVCSMGDIFHESVPFEWIDQVMAVIALCPQHTFQILTKRPERMKVYFDSKPFSDVACHESRIANHFLNYRKGVIPAWCDVVWPFPNLWLGVTAENQAMADKRIPILLDIPAAVRFVSVEPMLGEINFDICWFGEYDHRPTYEFYQTLQPEYGKESICIKEGLDWVIVGCESGPKRRECKLEWVESIIEQCQDLDVSVFVKQLALRRDKCCRDVTELSGLWDESDRFTVSKNMQEWPKHLQIRQFPKKGGEE